MELRVKIGKVLFLGILFMALCASLSGQEKEDSLSYDAIIKDIQFNLGEYHNERQTAYCLASFALFCSAAGTTLALLNNEERVGPVVAFGLSGITFVASYFIFVDSEKWLKRASITISPTSLKINF